MKVLTRGVMPDKTKVQMEDWSMDLPSIHSENDVIAAYPIAMRPATRDVFVGVSGKPCIWEYPQKYHPFRLAMHFPCADDAKKAYNMLLNGEAQLLDYVEYMQEKKYAECL